MTTFRLHNDEVDVTVEAPHAMAALDQLNELHPEQRTRDVLVDVVEDEAS